MILKALFLQEVLTLMPYCHSFCNCAMIKEFGSDKEILHLVIEGSNYLVSICEDSCSPTFLPSKKWGKNKESSLHSITACAMWHQVP